MAETKMGLVEWLDDLSVRFLLNLPPSELSSVPRLCFQVEEAQWYYEDFVRPLAAASGNPLPSLPLRAFCLALFQHCPLLSGFTDAQHIAAYEEFLAYKVRVPVRGAILLDESMERVLLVRGWKKGASWSFPRGKINKDEKDLDCAIREVYEETGFDLGASGLVPATEKEVKYFDITMREQHMRMFVFRGVPLDTFFEPRTRKEIGKIDWYDLQNLPGFAKKNKHTGEGGNTNKFYMVAPFMNPLKKWIGQQQRKNAAVAQTEAQIAIHGLGAHQEVDETDTDIQGAAPYPATVLDRSEELKRLLSIGALASGPPPIPTQVPHAVQASNLLAMLQSGGQASRNVPPPQTPMEQISAFPQVPETPQPHHPRQQALGEHQPPPQFPYSPAHAHRHQQLQHQQQSQQQQYNFPALIPGITGQSAGGSSRHNSLPSHLQQQSLEQQHHPSLPIIPVQTFGPANGAQLTQQHVPQMQQIHNVQPSSNAGSTHQFQPNQHPNVPIQGSQGAIAAGPSIPRASQLPPPKLNAHSMKLLEAFKSGNKPSDAYTGVGNGPRPTNTHQTALLDLFTASSDAQTPPVPQPLMKEDHAASPASVDPPLKPSSLDRSRSTVNEITRTLPMNLKPKRPYQQSPVTTIQNIPQLERSTAESITPQSPVLPASRPNHDHSMQSQTSFSPSSHLPALPNQVRAASHKTFKKQVNSTAAQRQQQPNRREPTSRQPKQQPRLTKPNAAGNGSAMPPPVPFTILTRPGSAKGKSESPVPHHNEPSWQSPRPQVLKRLGTTEESAQPAAESAHGPDRLAQSNGNREHLLSLFGKPPRQASLPSPAPPPTVTKSLPEVTSSLPGNGNKDALLGLFNSSKSQQSQSMASFQQSAPGAPHLTPNHRATKPATLTRASVSIKSQPPQSALLDLFKKPTNTTSNATSPETPISPFALGSPNTAQHNPLPSRVQMAQMQQQTQAGERSRIGSFASSGRGTPNSAGTPTEAKDKDFLLGFLNGVVQKEGRAKQ